MEANEPRFVPYADACETHISAVLFAGDRAYKQLKPIQTPFLDYRTVADRKVAAETEVELNRRLAPDVYLGVAEVRDQDDEVIDHLIVMRRMPSERRLSVLLEGPEAADVLRAVARKVAAFHAELTPNERAIEIAGLQSERGRWADNLRELREINYPQVVPDAMLDRIEELASRYLNSRAPLFEARARAGLARDGHGDLLADDIFMLEDGPRILDCLAFDESLRMGDVLADIAFLIMDVERRIGERAAAMLLRYYEEFSNEHHPPSLAHFYVGYRALVRAKIGVLRYRQTASRADAEAANLQIDQCLRHLERSRLRMVLVGGGPGTGKSTLAEGIGGAMRTTVLRTDEIRKSLAGIAATEGASAEPDEGIYEAGMTERTYAELVREAGTLLAHGESVVLDGSWTRNEHRELARATAREYDADIVELECRLDPAVAKERIVRRSASPWNVSDATPEIVDHMASVADPWPEALVIDTAATPGRCRALALRGILGFAVHATVVPHAASA